VRYADRFARWAATRSAAPSRPRFSSRKARLRRSRRTCNLVRCLCAAMQLDIRKAFDSDDIAVFTRRGPRCLCATERRRSKPSPSARPAIAVLGPGVVGACMHKVAMLIYGVLRSGRHSTRASNCRVLTSKTVSDPRPGASSGTTRQREESLEYGRSPGLPYVRIARYQLQFTRHWPSPQSRVPSGHVPLTTPICSRLSPL
jgi:hypothetical protein